MDAIQRPVDERQLLLDEALRVEAAARRSRREGRAVLNEILTRGGPDPGTRKAALSFSAKLVTMLRERERLRTYNKLDLWEP